MERTCITCKYSSLEKGFEPGEELWFCSKNRDLPDNPDGSHLKFIITYDSVLPLDILPIWCTEVSQGIRKFVEFSKSQGNL